MNNYIAMDEMEDMSLAMGEEHQLHGGTTAATITPIRGGTSALAALAARAHVELANLQREELSRPAVLIPAPSSNGCSNGKEARVIEEVPVTAIRIDYSNNRSKFGANKRNKFSVIVNPAEDSRDSDDLDKMVAGNSASMEAPRNDYKNYHQQPYPHISNLNGRTSPQRYSPNSSYATLTPLQPLPPISTVSDKFAYGHSSNVTGSFTIMQHNMAMGSHSPYGYDDKIMSPPHPYSSNMVMQQQNSPDSPQSTYSQNGGLSSPPRSSSPNSCYDSPYNQDLVRDQVLSSQSPILSPRSVSLSPPPVTQPPSHIVGPGSYTNSTPLPSINGLINAAHVIASNSGRCSSLSPPLVHSRQPSLIQSLAMGSPPINQPPPISPPPVESSQQSSLPQHLQQLDPATLSHHQQIQQAILNQQIENEVVVASSPSPPDHIQQSQSMTLSQHQTAQPPQTQQSQQQMQLQQSSNQLQQHGGGVQTCIQTTQQLRSATVSQQQQQLQQHQTSLPPATTSQQPSQQMSVLKTLPQHSNGSSSSMNSSTVSNTTDMEEINTKELAQRISAELKRYSIPQAIFAQRVLCRSQGTLSDLLRNPKPWSKLKSGRETFRRMWKWLQEPEFQRMSALRLAGESVFFGF